MIFQCAPFCTVLQHGSLSSCRWLLGLGNYGSTEPPYYVNVAREAAFFVGSRNGSGKFVREFEKIFFEIRVMCNGSAQRGQSGCERNPISTDLEL